MQEDGKNNCHISFFVLSSGRSANLQTESKDQFWRAFGGINQKHFPKHFLVLTEL